VTNEAPRHGEQALGHEGTQGHRAGVDNLPSQILLLGAGVDGLMRPPSVVAILHVRLMMPLRPRGFNWRSAPDRNQTVSRAGILHKHDHRSQ
jgi:hypothetical protein